jgi:hypothetical protein
MRHPAWDFTAVRLYAPRVTLCNDPTRAMRIHALPRSAFSSTTERTKTSGGLSSDMGWFPSPRTS